jgi:hypothetical protein
MVDTYLISRSNFINTFRKKYIWKTKKQFVKIRVEIFAAYSISLLFFIIEMNYEKYKKYLNSLLKLELNYRLCNICNQTHKSTMNWSSGSSVVLAIVFL